MAAFNNMPEDYTIADDSNDVPIHKSLENVKSDFKESVLPNQFDNDIEFSNIESLFYRQPTHIKKVCTLHFIIMYFDIEKLRSYLETIKDEHGILFVNLLLNFPIDYDVISYSLDCYSNPSILLEEYRENGLTPNYYGNTITSIHVAAMWSNDKEVIRLIYRYGASVWQTDKPVELGLFVFVTVPLNHIVLDNSTRIYGYVTPEGNTGLSNVPNVQAIAFAVAPAISHLPSSAVIVLTIV